MLRFYQKYHFYFIILQFLLTSSLVYGNTQKNVISELFPKPKYLQGNVEFWKKIYTEISINEGVLHDRKFPCIIYRKIYVGDKRGKAFNDYLKKSKNEIVSMLKRISSIPEHGLSSEEVYILDQFKKYSSKDTINKAIKRVRFQRGQKEEFKEGIERSGMFIEQIRLILKKYNIPERLAYLPCVESSFNQNAGSKAGAVGLWQFIKTTGRNYLTITKEIDERYDPILSTIAAAKLLKRNYKELRSWPLAITAYNHGLSGVKRAAKQLKTGNISIIIKKYKSPSFKFASKNFYSCFLAASEVAQNYKKFFHDVNIKQPFDRKRINLTNNVNYNYFYERLGISFNTFKKYNPALRPKFYKTKKNISKGYFIYFPKFIPLFNAKLFTKPANFISKNVQKDLNEVDLIENEIYWYD